MKNALTLIFILISIETSIAENRQIKFDIKKVCKGEEENVNSEIKLLDKVYTQSPNSTLIPDVKQILKSLNHRNRHRLACKRIAQLPGQGGAQEATAYRGPAQLPEEIEKIYHLFMNGMTLYPAMEAPEGN